jgi:hypothetical protein
MEHYDNQQNDIWHYDIKLNDVEHFDLQRDDIHHNIQRNDIQQSAK